MVCRQSQAGPAARGAHGAAHYVLMYGDGTTRSMTLTLPELADLRAAMQARAHDVEAGDAG
jgi:hypothetical protein